MQIGLLLFSDPSRYYRISRKRLCAVALERGEEMNIKPWSVLIVALTMLGCQEDGAFSPEDPARGPGGLVGESEPLNASFVGGADAIPQGLGVALPDDAVPPDCTTECLGYCDSLGFENPVNQGLCPSLWGVGLEPRPVVIAEACRRLFVDMIGRTPTRGEVESVCEGRPWGDVVWTLMNTEDFVWINQRRWSDKLLYNNQNVSIERIYDMDRLVGKLYRGLVPYDLFAATVSAHPVLTRRHDTPGDRAEALVQIFFGRPPLGDERSDLARLYNLWTNDYYDHPQLGMRLPDAFIEYKCLNELEKGECTSVLFGYNELILEPDVRSIDGAMWSGLLRPEEWAKMQLPGRVLTQKTLFWENAVDEVLELYLGYEMGRLVPQVRDQLVRFLIDHNADIRAVHYAVLTSHAYLQSAAGVTPTAYRWTYGPLKQLDVEPWLDSVTHTTGYTMGYCDHRIARPGDLIEANTIAATALLENSRWQLRGDEDEMEVRNDYSNMARPLGGCPSNEVTGRFKAVSILSTATQVSFVADVCNPTLEGEGRHASVAKMLPAGIDPNTAVTPDLAEQIFEHQVGLYFSRTPSEAERLEARAAGEQCQREVCTAEAFARPTCFALLSSAEMLFY